MLENKFKKLQIEKSKNFAFLKSHGNSTWVKIDFNEIAYISSDVYGSIFHYENGNTINSNLRLNEIEIIKPIGFERVHRNCIVNLDYIETVSLKNNFALLKFDKLIPLGMAYKENLYKYCVVIQKIKRKSNETSI